MNENFLSGLLNFLFSGNQANQTPQRDESPATPEFLQSQGIPPDSPLGQSLLGMPMFEVRNRLSNRQAQAELPPDKAQDPLGRLQGFGSGILEFLQGPGRSLDQANR